MNILAWILFGLIVGVAARWFIPDSDPRGVFATILLGIAGTVVGGLLGCLFGLGSVTGFTLGSFLLAVPGAFFFLWIYKRIRAA